MKKFLRSRAMMKKTLLFTAILFIFFGIIFAEQVKAISGKDLLDKITSKNKVDKDYALGYITGIYCVYMETSIPDERTMKRVVKIVKKYLKKNPEKLNRPAVELLKEAFDKAFPLKK